MYEYREELRGIVKSISGSVLDKRIRAGLFPQHLFFQTKALDTGSGTSRVFLLTGGLLEQENEISGSRVTVF